MPTKNAYVATTGLSPTELKALRELSRLHQVSVSRLVAAAVRRFLCNPELGKPLLPAEA
jgi:hypothetical protein